MASKQAYFILIDDAAGIKPFDLLYIAQLGVDKRKGVLIQTI
jgi:hypothetical protein